MCSPSGTLRSLRWAMTSALCALRVLGHALEERLADLHRLFVKGLLHAEGAGVPGTALIRLHERLGDHPEHFLGLLADVLHPRVARHVIAHLAERLREIGLEQPVALARHEVLER